MNRVTVVLGTLVFALALGAVWTIWIFEKGSQNQQAAQATAQVKQDQNVKREYDKIDSQVRNIHDKSTAIKWLLNRTSDR